MKNFKAGNFVHQKTYRSFQPELINKYWSLDHMELLQLLSQADRQIGRLDMYSEYIPNIELFISMHVVKEATQSSKIEGTQTSIADAILDKEDISDEKRDDWEEIQNYISALNTAIESLKDIPFSTRLIRETHRTLLKGVRGKHKQPGAYRKSQNWIGGASIKDAVFIPPVHTSVNGLMGDLEKFAHNSDFYFPELLKIALIHYQFETIHPFLDGNGRVGRLLIPLYLVEKEILKKPILYLSDFFERNRMLYYDNLMIVREKNDIIQWFKFFLVGIIETSKKGIETFDQILKLKSDIESNIQKMGPRATTILKVMDHLYRRPIIDPSVIIRLTGVSAPTAYKIIADLQKIGVLQEITGKKRKKVYAFNEYLKLF